MASNRLGRYEVIKPLARGALTDLLVGRASGMEGFQRYVAIKLLRAEVARDAKTFESFVSEARLAAVLHHHNIVQVHDIGEDDGRPYFAMEYVHGVDLRTLLAKLAKRNEQLPLQHVVSIVASVAAALHHAHEQRGPDGTPLGIVHRDVSPGNVLVGFDGNVKVVDFGIAKAAIKQMGSDAGVLKGQAPYMSPEQCAGKIVDRRSDVFSLGIVLYELATVRRLFKGASDFLTMSAIVNAEVPKPSQYRRDIPAQLEAIMLKALARDPVQRFQSAGEMSVALDKIASSVGVGASTTALANYMRLQFGDQKEPWLQQQPSQVFGEDEISEVTEVDFDQGASGLAPPPSEAVEKNAIPRAIAVSKSAPIVAARTHALTPVTDNKPGIPRMKGNTRPPPPEPETIPRGKVPASPPPVIIMPRKAGAKPLPAPFESPLDRAKTNRRVDGDEEVTEPEPLPLPPKLPTAHDASATAIVDPLPAVAPVPVFPPMRTQRSSRLLWLMLTVLLAGGGAIAVVTLWPGAELDTSAAPAAEPVPVANVEPAPATAEPPPAEPPPAEPPPVAEAPPAAEPPPVAEPPPSEPQKSGMQMTMADYERERAAAAEAAAKKAAEEKAAQEKAAEPVAETKAEPEPKAQPEPVAKKDPPAKRTTAKPPAKRTVAKVAAKPAAAKKAAAKKPAKKPKWNPDDLFLEDK